MEAHVIVLAFFDELRGTVLVPGREGRGTGEEDGGGACTTPRQVAVPTRMLLPVLEGAALLRRATEMGRAAAGGKCIAASCKLSR